MTSATKEKYSQINTHTLTHRERKKERYIHTHTYIYIEDQRNQKDFEQKTSWMRRCYVIWSKSAPSFFLSCSQLYVRISIWNVFFFLNRFGWYCRWCCYCCSFQMYSDLSLEYAMLFAISLHSFRMCWVFVLVCWCWCCYTFWLIGANLGH